MARDYIAPDGIHASLLPVTVQGCEARVEEEQHVYALPLRRRQRIYQAETFPLKATIPTLHKERCGWKVCGEENGFAIMLCKSCIKHLGLDW